MVCRDRATKRQFERDVKNLKLVRSRSEDCAAAGADSNRPDDEDDEAGAD